MATTKIIPGVLDLNQASSSTGLRMPKGSSAYAAPPTVAEGMMRNEVGQISNGSASCMQHYNGTDWKNFVNTVAGTTCDVNYPVANAGLFQLNGNITDETGNLTASDANITYVTGNFGQAAQWNNTGTSYINTGFSAGSANFSISFWFNDPNPSSWSYLFGTTSGGAVQGYSLNVSGGDLDIIIRNTSGGADIARVQGGVVSANTWHNIVFTFDSAGSGTNTIYLDGNAFTPTLGSNPFTGKPPSNSSTLYLGQAGSYVYPADQFDGKMDQVRIFTTTLTQDQVNDLQTETPC